MTELRGPVTLTDRQREIVEMVESQGFVTIEQLADGFDVSAQTVRRDIIALDAMGMLQRFHGGAGIGGSAAVRLGHGQKRLVAQDAKREMAAAAAQLVSPGVCLYIDVGTTTEAAAVELNACEGLTVFTNSFHVAAVFDPGCHDVHVLGGTVAGKDGSMVGETIVTQLLDLRLDLAMIGCSGIEADGSVMDFDPRKIAVKQAAMRVANRTCLLATKDKFGRTARARFANLTDFDDVISS